MNHKLICYLLFVATLCGCTKNKDIVSSKEYAGEADKATITGGTVFIPST